jgi:hypothetical protein
MNTRTPSVAEQGYMTRASEMVDEAMRHHLLAVDAHDESDDKALDVAHRNVHRCLRSAQIAFKSLAAAGAKADQAASQTVQTSSGTAKSDGSAGGRAAAPVRNTPGLLTNDPAEFLKRARLGSRR